MNEVALPLPQDEIKTRFLTRLCAQVNSGAVFAIWLTYSQRTHQRRTMRKAYLQKILIHAHVHFRSSLAAYTSLSLAMISYTLNSNFVSWLEYFWIWNRVFLSFGIDMSGTACHRVMNCWIQKNWYKLTILYLSIIPQYHHRPAISPLNISIWCSVDSDSPHFSVEYKNINHLCLVASHAA